MSTLYWIVAVTIMGGALSVMVASLFLLVPEQRRFAVLPHLISYATGALLGAALLNLLPQAVEEAHGHVRSVGMTLVAGIFAFFILEKFVLWRHCHQEDCEPHAPTQHHRDKASATLILAGDAIHNAIDGVLIAAAFLTDVRLGVVTAIAVIAHEIPQEVGDFAILLHSGMSRARALTLNLLTSLTSVAGGVIAYFALGQAMHALPYVLSIAAACFLYVAVADLIPGLHRRVEPKASLQQIILIALGVATIMLAGHNHSH